MNIQCVFFFCLLTGNMPAMGFFKTYRNFTNNYVNSSNIDRAAAPIHQHHAANNNNNNNNNMNNNNINGYRKMQPYQRYQNEHYAFSKGKGYESSANTGINWRNECRHTVDYDDSDLSIGLSPPSESMLLTKRRILRRSDIAIQSPPQTASG